MFPVTQPGASKHIEPGLLVTAMFALLWQCTCTQSTLISYSSGAHQELLSIIFYSHTKYSDLIIQNIYNELILIIKKKDGNSQLDNG